MMKGNTLFILLLILAVAAEALDHSTEPILFVLANIWEFVVAFFGVWKMLEVFNSWMTK